MTNRRARLFTTTGSLLATTDLNRFFGAVNASGTPVLPLLFDPKVIYDRASQTYFAVALQGGDSSLSRVYLSVSRPAVPGSFDSSAWCRYVFDSRITLGGVSTWTDYDRIGIGQNTIVVSTNQYSDADSFRGSVVRAWSKTYYANNTASCPAVQASYSWTRDGSNNLLPSTMTPTQHYTAPTGTTSATSPVYLINSVNGTANYRVWKVANLSSGSPLLYGPVTVTGNANILNPQYLAPGGANNLGIDLGDTRVLQVAGMGNRLHAVHTNRCQAGGGITESCIRYVQFSVANTASGGISASIVQQSLTGASGWYYGWPSIAVNSSGVAATAFNAAQIGGYRGAAWAVKPAASAVFGSVTWLVQGTCLLDATEDVMQDGTHFYRAGDYSGAALDPDMSSIWVSSERSAQISGVGCGWQTYVTRITGI